MIGIAGVKDRVGMKDVTAPNGGIAGLRVAPLSGNAAAFATLGFPRLAPVLDRLEPPWVAVGATVGLVPVSPRLVR